MMETKTSNNHSRVKCAWCGGTGKWSVAAGTNATCVVCHGQKLVSVEGYPSECRQCRGSGKSSPVSPCLTCAGAGWELVVGQ